MASRPSLPRSGSSIAAADKTIVLVSGGNAGIGYEIVKKLALENPTFHVLMGTRDTRKGEAAVASMGGPINANPIQLDLADDTSIARCAATIEQRFGRLDVLVNNAGTAGMDLGEGRTPREVYGHVLGLNVTGTALLTDAMAPLLEKAKQPRVVMVTSTLGSIQRVLASERKPLPVPSYSASKAAVNYLTVYYARQYPGWKVNAVCPGFRATALNQAKRNEETDPKKGAVRVVELVTEGEGGVTGTYSDVDGGVAW